MSFSTDQWLVKGEDGPGRALRVCGAVGVGVGEAMYIF